MSQTFEERIEVLERTVDELVVQFGNVREALSRLQPTNENEATQRALALTLTLAEQTAQAAKAAIATTRASPSSPPAAAAEG